MGLRFRKSFKIAKGIRINISKGGLSTSFGKKGLSLNVGKRGVYGNIGIPGTGLSSRTKLLGSSGRSSAGSAKRPDQMTPEELRSLLNELNLKLRAFQFVHMSTPSPTTPLIYQVRNFDKEKFVSPLRFWCGLGACLATGIWIWGFFFEVSTFFSWLVPIVFFPSLLISLAIPETQGEYEWRLEKEDFEINEIKKKAAFSNIVKNYPRDFMNGILKYALENVKCYSNLFLSCHIYQDSIFLRIDLPDFEFTPTSEHRLTPSGKSITQKTFSETQRRAYYAQHIHGVAFLYTGKIFQALPFVDNVIVSGYVERPSPATGHEESVCLYSVSVPREQWSQIDFSQLLQIDPIQAFDRFDIKRDLSKRFEFKPIIPIPLPSEAKPVRVSGDDELPLDAFVSSDARQPSRKEKNSERANSSAKGHLIDLDAFIDEQSQGE